MTLPARHLLTCEGLGAAEILELFGRAKAHKQAVRDGRPGEQLKGKAVANLFFENSTRTRLSFERAAKMLGAEVLNFAAQSSSVAKGETLLDTARNIDAMRVSAMVVRHASSGAAALLARHVRAAVINAGDGTHQHPSQGLLDAFTLHERLGKLDGRRVAIVGDILHSRVARSDVACLQALGAKVALCGPPTLLPAQADNWGCQVTTSLDQALEGADAVITLRLQLERQSESLFPSVREYARRWGLDAARAKRLKKGAMVMHPGPINRGIELASEVADGEGSVILDQVENGVAVRMAILERCA